MRKMNVVELGDKALDYAVALCEQVEFDEGGYAIWFEQGGLNVDRVCFSPSSNWSQGGLIIEREEITVQSTGDAAKWTCYTWDNVKENFSRKYYGNTPLIAAMRCYVASKLGDVVELPDALF